MNTCFFIGHHDAPLNLQERLNKTVEELARQYDVREFVVGYRGNFDQMATSAVQTVKRKRPELYAYRLLSYFPDQQMPPVPEFFDDNYYPLELVEVPRRYAIVKANQFMLEQCDYLVAYVNREGGNAGAILRRAKRMEKKGLLKVINLAEP